jgi:hypothetical protein
MQRESKSPLRAKRFSMSITHQRIQEERQEARHGSVTRNAARGEAGLSNCGANGRAFQGCVRFKSLEDLALDVRFAGRELYGGRPQAVASWSREADDIVLVKTGRPHRCARVRGGAHGQLPSGEGALGDC